MYKTQAKCISFLTLCFQISFPLQNICQTFYFTKLFKGYAVIQEMPTLKFTCKSLTLSLYAVLSPTGSYVLHYIILSRGLLKGLFSLWYILRCTFMSAKYLMLTYVMHCNSLSCPICVTLYHRKVPLDIILANIPAQAGPPKAVSQDYSQMVSTDVFSTILVLTTKGLFYFTLLQKLIWRIWLYSNTLWWFCSQCIISSIECTEL